MHHKPGIGEKRNKTWYIWHGKVEGKENLENPPLPCSSTFLSPLFSISLSIRNSNGDFVANKTKQYNGRAWKPQNRFALGARVTKRDDVIRQSPTCPKKGPAASCSRFILIVHVILSPTFALTWPPLFLRVFNPSLPRHPPSQIKRIEDCKLRAASEIG